MACLERFPGKTGTCAIDESEERGKKSESGVTTEV